MCSEILDGPPVNKFIEDGKAYFYQTVALGSDGNFISLASEFNNRLSSLIDAAGDRMLIWRQKPEVSIDNRGYYFMSARLTFYPELSQEDWDNNFKPKPEGEMCEMIDK